MLEAKEIIKIFNMTDHDQISFFTPDSRTAEGGIDLRWDFTGEMQRIPVLKKKS